MKIMRKIITIFFLSEKHKAFSFFLFFLLLVPILFVRQTKIFSPFPHPFIHELPLSYRCRRKIDNSCESSSAISLANAILLNNSAIAVDYSYSDNFLLSLSLSFFSYFHPIWLCFFSVFAHVCPIS